ncbi:hypothetical protein ABL78_2874 [Leptomonas seymouri]|uniref:Mitochondrial glycoprotein-like protein n=1 Tax=Leptomonas seymouri TaxID=5684 RepID=A0A0N1PDY6_LEPSE|nr:hypothetical protein ABL78_2874 [Leptomonas seymouri]|eukprot:KPI88048.1 hypothetical protein ABL78_2874 [Leptomonas seymouri]
MLRSLASKSAYAALSAAAAAGIGGRVPCMMSAAPIESQIRAASVLACIRNTAPLHNSASLAQRSFYATGPTAGDSQDDVSRDKIDEGGAGAIDYAHTPSLRDALPPSAVELPEESFLKCIEKEMMDEKYRLDKEEGPPPVPVGWTMHHTEGTSFIYGRRVWMPPPSASSSSAPVQQMSSNSNDSSSNHTEGAPTGEAGGEHTPHQPACAPVPRAIEKHFLRLQLTMRDASLDPECDVRGEHFPFSFFVQRVRPEGGDESGSGSSDGGSVDLESDAFDEHTFYHDSIEVRCDVVDGELVVDNVVYHGSPHAASTTAGDATGPHYANPFGGYPGPNLDEAEEEVLDGIQSWLAERGVDDQLGEFIGQYAIWIEQAEYELWLQQLRDYVAA